MSLILDALKRAERERRAGQTPMPLDSITVPAPESERGGARRWLLPALIGAVVAGVSVYLWVALRSPSPTPAVVTAPVAVIAAAPAATVVSPPAADSIPAVATTETRPAPAPAAGNTGGAATLDDLVDDKQTSGSGSDARAESKTSPPDQAGPPRESGGKRRAEPDSSAATGASEQLPPFEQPVGPPPPDTTPPAAAPSSPVTPAAPASLPATLPATNPTSTAQSIDATTPARSFKEMSPNYRAEFPTLSIDVHVYDADPQRRFVMLNGKRYHEGDTIAEGPRIVGIVADGIVFDYRGERIEYPLTH